MLTRLLDQPEFGRVIVFTRTKHAANRVAERLLKSGVTTEAIHGNKSQAARQKALENLRNGKVRVLVATDILARGIDVDNVSHVINYELPNVPEDYVHRIGRTARAGSDGVAISFCDVSERSNLRSIERFLGRTLTQEAGSELSASDLASEPVEFKASRKARRRRQIIAAPSRCGRKKAAAQELQKAVPSSRPRPK